MSLIYYDPKYRAQNCVSRQKDYTCCWWACCRRSTMIASTNDNRSKSDADHPVQMRILCVLFHHGDRESSEAARAKWKLFMFLIKTNLLKWSLRSNWTDEHAEGERADERHEVSGQMNVLYVLMFSWICLKKKLNSIIFQSSFAHSFPREFLAVVQRHAAGVVQTAAPNVFVRAQIFQDPSKHIVRNFFNFKNIFGNTKILKLIRKTIRNCFYSDIIFRVQSEMNVHYAWWVLLWTCLWNVLNKDAKIVAASSFRFDKSHCVC